MTAMTPHPSAQAGPGAETPPPGARQRGWLSELATRMLLVAGGLVLGLLVAELAVRLVRPQVVLDVDNDLYLADAAGNYRLRPGFSGTITNHAEFAVRVAINSAGLRGPEIATDAQGGLRILALGDSFTFGFGVEEEETYIARLAASLSAQGVRAEALNAGVPGYGIHDAVAWWQRHGHGLHPDLIVLGICLANDLQNAILASEDLRIAYGFPRRGWQPGLGDWLYFNSHLFTAVKRSVPTRGYRRIRAWLGLAEPSSLESLRWQLMIYQRVPSEDIVESLAVIDGALGRLAARAEAQGVPVIAVLIPALVQVDPDRWQRGMDLLEADPDHYDPEAPNRLLQDLLAAHGIPTLDLTAPLAAAVRRGITAYFPRDRHWTPAGHRVAAEPLEEFLIARGLFPSRPGEASSADPTL